MPEIHDPCQLTARALADRLRRGQLSAVDALAAHLARIDRDNPALGAVVSIDRDRAHQQAVAADAALRRGEPLGPLHGVPMTLDDAHDVAGLRTTVGAAALDRLASEDGAVAARLRAAGANLFGHTNVAAYLADYQSANDLFGRTANPWDPARTAGGSSGGAAAALAAGMTPLEVGSDMAGSIRLPAHFCGVYGLKTTEHRVPLTGFFRPPPGTPRPVRIMSCLGPMARDLGDLELALSIIAGPDRVDADVAPVPLSPPIPRHLGDLRLAVATSLPGVPVAREVREEIERVAARASDAGAEIVERLPELDWAAIGELFGGLVSALTGQFDPTADLPDHQRSLAWYLEALDRRDHLAAAWDAFFDDIDALLLPPAMTTAFPHAEQYADIDVDGEPRTYADHGRLLVFANVTGAPALVAPAGSSGDGLPIGVQIVGPRWSEIHLIEIARALEEAGVLPGFQRPPDPARIA